MFHRKKCHFNKFHNESKVWSQKVEVHCYIKDSKNKVCQHMCSFHLLNQKPKMNRGDSGLKIINIGRTNGWKSFFLSDKKRFNFDVPDDWNSYWQDLRHQPWVPFNRQRTANSVMTWGVFSFNGTTDIALLEGKQTFKQYIEVFDSDLLFLIVEILGAGNYQPPV